MYQKPRNYANIGISGDAGFLSDSPAGTEGPSSIGPASEPHFWDLPIPMHVIFLYGIIY